MTGLAHRRLRHTTRPRDVPAPVRVAAGAASGHAVGAVVGAVLLSGPAARWPSTVGLVLVHVLADLGAGVGAARAAPWTRTGVVVAAVVAGGTLASVGVLWLLGTDPLWLLVRAALVVVLAVVVAGARPGTGRT